MRRCLGRWFLIAACVGLLVGPFNLADTPSTCLGKKVPSFALTDPRDQCRLSLAEIKDAKAVVVLFVGTECPINNVYLPRLAELHREYGPKGVQFLAINSNEQDTLERVADHAKKHALPFPVLKDERNRVADAFGAQRTPEVFVLDAELVIRYHGRIDDQFAIKIQRPKPSRRDLAVALDELLAGMAVSVASTPVTGCLIGRAPKPKTDASVTFSKDVARILQKNCQECHRPGQVGPMALVHYDDVAPWAAMVQEVVSAGRMPPWYADPRFGKFSNDRRLAAEDKKTLLAWIEQGCPEGDKRDLPPPVNWPAGWRIGMPDLILSMPEEFEVPAQTPRGGVPYKHFVIDPGFTEDKWVVRAQAKPGAAAVVHHILVFILPPGQTFNPNNPRNIVLGGTAPGDSPTVLRPGQGKKIPAGSKLVFQLHYTPNGKAQKDRSSIGLIFAKPGDKLQEVRTIAVFNALFRIPPGDPNHEVQSSFTFPKDGQVTSLMPHMHLRGKDFKFEAVFPDGKRQTLLFVPRYDFNWQSSYRLAEPVRMLAGSTIHCTAHYDNSANNPNNPDPSKAIYWGDQTWQEMMVGWMDVVFDP